MNARGLKELEGQDKKNARHIKKKSWLRKGDGTLRKEGEGEWVITYTPEGGGIGHSRALSWYAPHILNDRSKLKEARKAAKEVITLQLDNPDHKQFIKFRRRNLPFSLAWIEDYKLK